MAIRFSHRSRLRDHSRAFTLLEVALIVAIIGMMLLIIVGYLLAPKQTGPLPPVAAPTLIPPLSTPPPTPAPTVIPVPAATPSAGGAAPSFR